VCVRLGGQPEVTGPSQGEHVKETGITCVIYSTRINEIHFIKILKAPLKKSLLPDSSPKEEAQTRVPNEMANLQIHQHGKSKVRVGRVWRDGAGKSSL
jgi:hypothetical protein